MSAVTERLADFLDGASARAAHPRAGGVELADRLVGVPGPSSVPMPLHEALALLFDEAIPTALETSGPGYLAYIPGGGLPLSAVADLIAGITNRFTGIYAAAPALVQLEANVIRWFCDIVGYPASAAGYLTSGGSLANLGALITARTAKLGYDLRNARLYASTQAHHSVFKAARLAGLPPAAVRLIDTDDSCRMSPAALDAAIVEDRRAGAEPFCVVASAGTTNTGAIDPLTELADIAAARGLWMHVDGAYGGFFAMTDRGRARLAGLERADSITLDPHKSLFLPYGTGCLLTKRRSDLEAAHGATAEYLPPMQQAEHRTDFALVSPELSKPFRGLRVWLPLAVVGAEAFRAQLDEKLDLAQWCAEALAEIPGVRVVCPPQLSLLAFCLAPPSGADAAVADALNQALLDEINARGRVYLTGTRLNGRFVLRICVLSLRTHLDRLVAGLADIREAAEDVLARSVVT